MSDETRRVATEFFEAFGRRDVDALMQIVSEDIVEDLPGVGIVSGLEEERAFLTGLFGSFPDLTTEVTRITIDGRVAAIEWKRWGTFTGAPWQGLPASGRAFESSGATFVEVDDGRVTKVTVYSDSAQVARGIGVLPAEGSAGERLARALYGLQVRLGRAGRLLTGNK
jgi:steroid delta-isomerase-like uncharacterized protein